MAFGKNKPLKDLDLSDWKYQQYKHGGSRMFFDGESGERQLIVDTYYTEEFAAYINKAARGYFEAAIKAEKLDENIKWD